MSLAGGPINQKKGWEEPLPLVDGNGGIREAHGNGVDGNDSGDGGDALADRKRGWRARRGRGEREISVGERRELEEGRGERKRRRKRVSHEEMSS